MKKAISLILAVGLTAAALIAATGYAAPKVGAAAPQLQTAFAAQAAAAQNQASVTSPCDGAKSGDTAWLGGCIGWIFGNFKISQIAQAIYDAGQRICVTQPGPPTKHQEPPSNPTPPPCPSCQNGQPGGDAP